MIDTFLLYMSNEGCFFQYAKFCMFYDFNKSIFKRENVKKDVIMYRDTSEYKTTIFKLRFLRHFYIAFNEKIQAKAL